MRISVFLPLLLVASNDLMAACPATITGTIINIKAECGAVGNGTTDDTYIIQDAINKMASKTNGLGGDVYFLPGTYLVKNAIQQNPIEPGKSEIGDIYLNLKSNVNLRLDSSAKIKAAPDSDKNGSYNVLYIRGKKNIKISGGTIEGERASVYPPASQYGMGIGLYNGSTNITIEGITVKNAWGNLHRSK
jgi:polygalacturonase